MEPVALPLHCASCHGAVTLQFEDWPAEPNAVPIQEQTWTCPCCQRENAGGFPVKIAWVTKGHREPKVRQ